MEEAAAEEGGAAESAAEVEVEKTAHSEGELTPSGRRRRRKVKASTPAAAPVPGELAAAVAAELCTPGPE